ncbi:stage II sporulation protein D [Clostridium tertium]|uniref:stage II sporulation protein D n=1 Tax=Clostridium TaxID=1485 RepID=UPI001158655F|nr:MULTISPECIES: stage II sporulation protein D [Clostridium]MBS5307268.1 stage II sporulation protein D [Clostridium sp.]MDB1924255.1 stage II sporulation protein D [Clostridium tertium]MDB1927403.1 stage II sporulation protein D [Clostridium tertium]MDB1931327.1 stage II sporulation protein D [Clostridium tertium]MDB1935195.1 stage II sporulation protein D [Clostridium tertium]
MKNKLSSIEGLLSLIFFSALVLISMIAIPMLVIKSSPVSALEERQVDNTDVNTEVKEDNFVTLAGNDIIKVHLTKEDKIIEIPLEEYVKSVVSGEMLASFESEALKAQAVAARTYVAAKKARPCNEAKGGDVCDTTHCQVFITKESRLEKWGDQGNEYWAKISEAVDATKGMVLTYDNELVQYPQFFSTSSGMTENAVDVFSSAVPYLVSTESKGEEIAPKFTSEFPFDISKFVSDINSKYEDAKISEENLQNDIEILGRSDAGGVKEIRFGGAKIKGLDFRLAFGLSSTNFQFTINGDKIIFNCKGYGHGVGMSQWGANVMAKDGKGYEEILKHYYTGIELKEVKFN